MEEDFLNELKFSHYPNELRPMVSVVMIAYNIEKYLTAAIESVITQRTSFKVELVIGEDCSTDNTRKIAIEYKNKYPEIIKLLLHKKNLGLTPNCVSTHNACKGKYIALLDGDDYWTDPEKLERQIKFLESHDHYSGCAHQALIISEEGMEQHLFGETGDKDYTLQDTISHRKFHTSSLIYRKSVWDKSGGIPENISSNERAIYPMVAIFGKIRYLSRPMCVYRQTLAGLSSSVKLYHLETDLNMLPWLKKLDKNFPVKKFKSFLHLCIFTYGKRKPPLLPLIKHYFLFSVMSFSYFPKNLGDLKWGTIFFLKRLINTESRNK